jgi:glycosyltransferase involved in cell wall biosynthesis
MNIFVVHGSHRLTDHAAHGDGLIAWGFIKALAARGHRVWVAAPRIDVLERDVPGITLFELRPRTRGKITQVVEYAVRSRLLYERLAREVRFDVIHQMNPVVRGYSFGMIGIRTPLVLGPYNGDWPVSPPTGALIVRSRQVIARTARFIVDLLMQIQAKALLVTTPYALNRLPGVNPQSPKLHVVPNGINDKEFSPANSSESCEPSVSTILMVGNATHKGIYTMLAAFEVVASSLPSVELAIAGGGPQTADVRARVAASPHRERYRLLGSISRSDMPRVIADARVVCVPSFGEPFGMIVLEAMASGKPVVGTNIGGIPYLLGVESELLFPPGDHAALARILSRLIVDRDLCVAIGLENRKRVAEHFTWESVARDLESAYASTRGTTTG